MPLLPRIPCRKLFVDSRHALPGGSSTEFKVEIPQGGIDLPDSCVAFIDSISIPSFPNVFTGRHRLFYREETAHEIALRYVALTGDNNTLVQFVAALGTALTGNPSALTNTIGVGDVHGIQFTLTGLAATETLRVLTDAELATVITTAPNWGVDATDWNYTVVDLAGAWTDASGNALTITADALDPKWWRWRFASETGRGP